MRGRKTSLHVDVTSEERSQLEQCLRSRTVSLGLARRCRAILGVADGLSLVEVARLVDLTEKHVRKWVQRFLKERLQGFAIVRGAAASRSFPPEVAMHVVKIACERPDDVVARCRSGIASRLHVSWWRRRGDGDLAGDGPSDPAPPSSQAVAAEDVAVAQGAARRGVCRSDPGDLRPLHTALGPDEVVLCTDEMTSLQPRPRKSERWRRSKTDRPGRARVRPLRALNLFAAFDTRTGKVYGMTASRKRQSEFIAFLEQLDRRSLRRSRRSTSCWTTFGSTRASSAGVAEEAPAVRVPSPARPLLVDEPGGAVVRHPQAEATAHCRLPQQGASGRATDSFHQRVE